MNGLRDQTNEAFDDKWCSKRTTHRLKSREIILEKYNRLQIFKYFAV